MAYLLQTQYTYFLAQNGFFNGFRLKLRYRAIQVFQNMLKKHIQISGFNNGITKACKMLIMLNNTLHLISNTGNTS